MAPDFYHTYLLPGFWIVLQIVLTVGVVMLTTAYVVYGERKVLGLIQLRQGPNVVGPFGLLQSFADALKLLTKETIIPSGANRLVFFLAPMLTFILSLMAWAVIPIAPHFAVADINVGLLYMFAISSMGVYGIIMAGWASNSRYAFLGGLRSAAQMVSYEVSIGLVIVTVLLATGSLNLSEIVLAPRPWWLQILLLPMLVVFFVSALAETNRAPFDLPEGESELVGGYNVEYSSFAFVLFFLGEYINMMVMSALTTILFLGGWLPPFNIHFLAFVPGPIWFALKIFGCLFTMVWVRGTVPRYRYDQLMRLGWKIFLPFSLVWVIFIAGILLAAGRLPV